MYHESQLLPASSSSSAAVSNAVVTPVAESHSSNEFGYFSAFPVSEQAVSSPSAPSAPPAAATSAIQTSSSHLPQIKPQSAVSAAIDNGGSKDVSSDQSVSLLEELLGYGFNHETCIEALSIAGSDLSLAVEICCSLQTTIRKNY